MNPSCEALKVAVCDEIDRQADYICQISEDIMKHPETGYRETATAAYVGEQFDALGLPHEDGLALTGVKSRLKGRDRKSTL